MGIAAVQIAMTEAYLEAFHSLYLASQAVAQSVGTSNIVRKMRI